MVKLAGPAMSLEASGTIGGILTFSKWKGRPYVRTRVIPTNPKTAAQLAVRSVMKFLAQVWKDLDESDQLTWNVLAADRKIAPFNAFTSFNLRHWRDSFMPSKTPAFEQLLTTAAITASMPATAGRYAYSDVTIGAGAGQWGLIVYMSTLTGFVPAWNNARLLVPALPSASTSITIGPLASGTHFLRYSTFTTDGGENKTYITQDSVIIP